MSYLIHPWNPFGDNPECVVKDESISAVGEERDLLVPRYGPFFEKNFVLKDAQTGVELTAGKDFVFAYPFNEFIEHYNRTVFGGITLLAGSVGRQLTIESYRTIGEPFTLSDQDFLSLVANIIHTERIADWSQVVNLPMEGFPADPHEQEVDLTYNYTKLIEVLQKIDTAQRNEFNNPTVASELAEHIATAMHLAHPEATAEDFNLGNVANYRPATDADLAGNSDQLYLTLAKGRKLFNQLLDELGILPEQAPIDPTPQDDLDRPMTVREAMNAFLSKTSDLTEISARGESARRNARENLGLGNVIDARIKQETGQSTTDLMSQKAITDELNKRVPMTRKVNGKALSADISLSAADVGAYTKAETDTRLNNKFDKSSVQQSTGSSTSYVMSQKAVTDQLGTKVPTSRKVNGKPLTGDISLNYDNVGAYSTAKVDQLIGTRVPTSRKVNGKALTSDITISASDVGSYTRAQVDSLINGRVPTSRTVNGLALSSNISLTAGHVGAYTKSETNSLLNNKFDKNHVSQGTGSSTSYVMSQKATTDQLNGKVPTGRKINGQTLTRDISITASSLSCYTKSEVDSRLNGKFDKSYVQQATGSSTAYVMSQKAVTDHLNNRVPTYRKVNGKSLVSDITLSKADIGLSIVENKRWTVVKSGSCNFSLANGINSYRGEINTGIKWVGRRFNPQAFQVVMKTDGGVDSGHTSTCWWSAHGEVLLKQFWTAGNQVWIRVYGSGSQISAGKITGYDLLQWK